MDPHLLAVQARSISLFPTSARPSPTGAEVHSTALRPEPGRRAAARASTRLTPFPRLGVARERLLTFGSSPWATRSGEVRPPRRPCSRGRRPGVLRETLRKLPPAAATPERKECKGGPTAPRPPLRPPTQGRHKRAASPSDESQGTRTEESWRGLGRRSRVSFLSFFFAPPPPRRLRSQEGSGGHPSVVATMTTSPRRSPSAPPWGTERRPRPRLPGRSFEPSAGDVAPTSSPSSQGRPDVLEDLPHYEQVERSRNTLWRSRNLYSVLLGKCTPLNGPMRATTTTDPKPHFPPLFRFPKEEDEGRRRNYTTPHSLSPLFFAKVTFRL